MAKRGEKRIPRKWKSFHSFPLHCSLESVVITTMPTLQWRLGSNGKTSLPNVDDGVLVDLADGELDGHDWYSCIEMRHSDNLFMHENL